MFLGRKLRNLKLIFFSKIREKFPFFWREQKISKLKYRNYRKFQGQGWTAPGISVKSVAVCSDNGQANE